MCSLGRELAGGEGQPHRSPLWKFTPNKDIICTMHQAGAVRECWWHRSGHVAPSIISRVMLSKGGAATMSHPLSLPILDHAYLPWRTILAHLGLCPSSMKDHPSPSSSHGGWQGDTPMGTALVTALQFPIEGTTGNKATKPILWAISHN